jgi:hypothetical protein
MPSVTEPSLISVHPWQEALDHGAGQTTDD